MSAVIQEVAYGSALYEQIKALRDETLRRPLGLVLTDADVAGEEHEILIAAVADGAVVGSVQLKPVSPLAIKLRQMTVAERLRGTGLGRRLVLFAEDVAAARGHRLIELNARADALGFYERLGYRAAGEPFLEVGLPHRHMSRRLPD